jgi:hypothetical protein
MTKANAPNAALGGNTLLGGTTIAGLSDGFVGRQIDQAMAEIYKDIDDRGTDGLARTLTITIKFVPTPNSGVEITPKIQAKLPAHQPYKTMAKMDLNAGGIRFNPNFAENPDQRTILDNGEVK